MESAELPKTLPSIKPSSRLRILTCLPFVLDRADKLAGSRNGWVRREFLFKRRLSGVVMPPSMKFLGFAVVIMVMIIVVLAYSLGRP
jgi:hypothetical protein